MVEDTGQWVWIISGLNNAIFSMAGTEKGLPAYALFTGHYNDYTDREYADIDEMEEALRTALQKISSFTIYQTGK